MTPLFWTIVIALGISLIGAGIFVVRFGGSFYTKIDDYDELRRRMVGARRTLSWAFAFFLVSMVARPIVVVVLGETSEWIRYVVAGVAFVSAFLIVLEAIELMQIADRFLHLLKLKGKER